MTPGGNPARRAVLRVKVGEESPAFLRDPGAKTSIGRLVRRCDSARYQMRTSLNLRFWLPTLTWRRVDD